MVWTLMACAEHTALDFVDVPDGFAYTASLAESFTGEPPDCADWYGTSFQVLARDTPLRFASVEPGDPYTTKTPTEPIAFPDDCAADIDAGGGTSCEVWAMYPGCPAPEVGVYELAVGFTVEVDGETLPLTLPVVLTIVE